MKRDKIFYSACGLSALGGVLAVMGHDLSPLLFVAAYLLRPALHEFGLAKKYADEREREIYSRSGNLAFIVVMLVVAGFALWRIADGKRPDELYTIIGIGLAVRALTGLVMVGDYRKAGVVIISAVGVFTAVFIILEGGLSIISVFGVAVGLLIMGVGQLARRFPKTIATLLSLLGVGAILFLRLYAFRRVDMAMWLFFVAPVLTSALCLFLGGGNEERVTSARVRSIAFGALGAGAALVFAALVVVSGRDGEGGRTAAVPEGAVTEVQGVACAGLIDYYPNGNLESCTLARDDTLSGQPLPGGTIVAFTEDGVFDWCFLQQDTEIQGHLCRGGGHNFMTAFYPNGQLRQAWLAEDEVIQEIPCAKFRFLSAVFGSIHGKNGGTSFYDDGRLRYCELSKNTTIQGRAFRKGDAVRFDADGRLKVKKGTE